MDKKIIALVIVIIILVIVAGIVIIMNLNQNNAEETNTLNNAEQNNSQISNVEQNTLANNNEITNTTETETTTQTNDNTRIRLIFNNEEIYVKLDDNQSSKELLEMLPLTLEFEDYNDTEKIATLPENLSTQGAPSGYDPQIGDFSYYAPWGNLSVFYKDFRYSNSLVKLGTIESGIEKLENMNENFTVRIEKAD